MAVVGTQVLVNLALIDGENANRHGNGCLPPGELHSPGHCTHSMDHGHKEWMWTSPGLRPHFARTDARGSLALHDLHCICA